MRRPALLSGARDRGQAMSIEILKLFVGMVLAALLAIMLKRPFDKITEHTRDATTNQTAMTGTDWSVLVFSNLPFYFLAMGAFGIIVAAVFLQRRG